MILEKGIIGGDVRIKNNTKMTGIFTGNVTIENGALLILNGIAKKSITIESGGSLEVNGAVFGVIYNKGGSLNMNGVVEKVVE